VVDETVVETLVLGGEILDLGVSSTEMQVPGAMPPCLPFVGPAGHVDNAW